MSFVISIMCTASLSIMYVALVSGTKPCQTFCKFLANLTFAGFRVMSLEGFWLLL
jgi:hypothetical protein